VLPVCCFGQSMVSRRCKMPAARIVIEIGRAEERERGSCVG
jgi:hypothetical protein